jgi:O-antigen ligase
MLVSKEVELRLARWVSIGALGVTLLVTDRVSNDPVNVGKMLLLTTIAGASFALTVTSYKQAWRQNKSLLATLCIFLLISLISIILSKDSWERGFFGAFGRNTGLLTYTGLSVLLLATSFFRTLKSIRLILSALLVSGLINLIYCFVALSGYDIFAWKNPYNSILGTLGNPNFISAFLGMFVTALSGLLFVSNIRLKYKPIIGLIILASIYMIRESLSIQGLLVSIAGVSIVIFFYLRSATNGNLVVLAYSGVIGVGGLFVLFGTLQKGPLSSLLYKPSVSYRGEYWQAGINMGAQNPFTGVGMDSYGTFYRKYRASSAAISPGVNVQTDTAHNVFIDIFAGVGILGLICYLVLTGLILKASYKLAISRKAYDPVFVILFASWFTYQLQSFISINQIGLAVWGWVLGGGLLAYSRFTDREEQLERLIPTGKMENLKKPKKGVKATSVPISAAQALSLFAGCALGFVIGLPPFLTDVKMRQALLSNDPEKVISQSLAWPQDANRSNRAIVALANGGLTERAKELSIQAAQKYPEDYATFFTLHELSPDGSTEKAAYRVKLHAIDPLNPEFAPK